MYLFIVFEENDKMIIYHLSETYYFWIILSCLRWFLFRQSKYQVFIDAPPSRGTPLLYHYLWYLVWGIERLGCSRSIKHFSNQDGLLGKVFCLLNRRPYKRTRSLRFFSFLRYGEITDAHQTDSFAKYLQQVPCSCGIKVLFFFPVW